MNKYTSKDIQRFWSKVDQSGSADSCWNWTASLSRGYGKFKIGGRKGNHLRAQRVAYELSYGEIPPGFEICHSCDNPACCNPKHLKLGTHLENMQDMIAKGRARYLNGKDLPQTKLTGEQVRTIRSRYHTGGTTQKELSIEMDVTIGTISNVVNNKTHKGIK